MKSMDKNQDGKRKEKTAGSRLRLLDFDDLFLLGHLLDGETVAATARHLGLTQPAITQRIRKIERVFGEPILQKAGRHVKLTPRGFEVCNRAADALSLMRGQTTDTQTATAKLATMPFLAEWFYQRMAGYLFDFSWEVHIASDMEMVEQLESNAIHAAIVEDESRFKDFHRELIAEDECLLVASPEMAARARNQSGDLVFLDREISMPWLRRLDPGFRAKNDLGQVHFLGLESVILKAAIQGKGLAALPRAMVAPALASGQLEAINPEMEIQPLRTYFVHRQDARLVPAIEAMIKAIRTEES